MGLRIASYNSNLFSVGSCDLLPSSRCILLNWIPSCFRLVNMRFLQFSLCSRCSPKYFTSSAHDSISIPLTPFHRQFHRPFERSLKIISKGRKRGEETLRVRCSFYRNVATIRVRSAIELSSATQSLAAQSPTSVQADACRWIMQIVVATGFFMTRKSRVREY